MRCSAIYRTTAASPERHAANSKGIILILSRPDLGSSAAEKTVSLGQINRSVGTLVKSSQRIEVSIVLCVRASRIRGGVLLNLIYLDGTHPSADVGRSYSDCASATPSAVDRC